MAHPVALLCFVWPFCEHSVCPMCNLCDLEKGLDSGMCFGTFFVGDGALV